MLRAVLQRASEGAGLVWPFAPAERLALLRVDFRLAPTGSWARIVDSVDSLRMWAEGLLRLLRRACEPACWVLGHRWWMSCSTVVAGRRVGEVLTCRRCERMRTRRVDKPVGAAPDS